MSNTFTNKNLSNEKSLKLDWKLIQLEMKDKLGVDIYESWLKKMNVLIENKKKTDALKFLPKLNSELMKIAKTGIIKKENASRNVSRITKKISSI